MKDEKAVLDKVMEHENRNKADAGAVIEKKFSLEKRLGEVEKVIAKIYVGDVRKVDGEKVQSIEIHYRFIGSLSDGRH